MTKKNFLIYILLLSMIHPYSKACAISKISSNTEQATQTRESEDDVYESTIYSDEDVEKFLSKLKDAVNREDKAAVAKMIKYPCRCLNYKNPRSRKSYVTNEKDTIEKYDMIITPEVKKIIIEANDWWTGSEYGIGPDVIWFTPEDVIIAINHPRKDRKPGC